MCDLSELGGCGSERNPLGFWPGDRPPAREALLLEKPDAHSLGVAPLLGGSRLPVTIGERAFLTVSLGGERAVGTLCVLQHGGFVSRGASAFLTQRTEDARCLCPRSPGVTAGTAALSLRLQT